LKAGGATGVSPAASTARRNYTLGVVLLVFVVHHVDRNILLLLMEPIRKEFGLNDSSLGLLSGIAYALPFALAGVPLGALADRVVRTRMVAILVILWSLCTAAAGLARNFAWLLVTRAAIGAAESGAPPALVSLLSDTYPPKSRAGAMSILFMGPFVGLLAGSVFGGMAAKAFGWRGALLIAAVPGFLVALLILLTVREPERGSLDPEAGRSDPAVPVREVVAFMWRHVPVRNTVLGMVSASIVSIGFGSWIPATLMRVHGLPVAQAGLMTALAAGLPGALGSIAAGWIATRFAGGDNCRLLKLCALAVGIAAPLGALGAWSNSLPLALLGFTLWAFTNTMYIGPGHSSYVGSVAPRLRGTLSALVIVTCNLIGASLGPQFVGSMSDLLRSFGDVNPLPHALALLAFAGFIPAWLFLRAARSAAPSIARR
jgi:predicted MFS family arabinose efflux permease